MAERNDILMPKLGLTMTEGIIAEWVAAAGDDLQPNDLMFVVETDKVATEITAPSAGKLLEILVVQGQTVPVGTPVARWTGDGHPSEGLCDPERKTANVAEAELLVQDQGNEGAKPNEADLASQAPRKAATPLARRLAHEGSVDLRSVVGSGPRGRIKAQDVRQMVEQPGIQSPKQIGMLTNQPPVQPSKTAIGQTNASSLVQVMARRMVMAKQEVPHFYLASEAEVTQLLELRSRLNEQSSVAKITLNHFLLMAVAKALAACPWQNQIWGDQGIVSLEAIDVGMAVSTPRGLMAPVLRDLRSNGLDDVASKASALVQRVRDGQAKRDDLEGGAITISNAGMLNVTYMTPIINPPQSAILGVGSVREVFRPDQNRAPVLKQEMGLVLACDHRLHDGTSGLKFLNTVIELLENPHRLLRPII